MMNMIKYVRSPVVLIITIITLLLITHNNIPKTQDYKLEVIRLESGWGYIILKNKKPFIYQECIPAIEGNRPFPDKISAHKTGKIVLKKLLNHKSPHVSKEELRDSAHINNI